MTDVELTNLDRPLYPNGFTKGDLVAYYRDVAPAILPYLRDRAVTLFRAPSGVEASGWYQTNCTGAPEWLRVVRVRGRGDAVFRMCVLEEQRSLVWAAQVGTIEFHPFLARLSRPSEPDWLVLDLDPGDPAGLPECSDVALALRRRLESAHPKTSGSVGLHVLVPVSAMTFAETRAWAAELAAGIPGVVTSQRRALRRGKVLVDVLQNARSRSLVAPWSLRATAWPLVSAPVSWDEVELCARARRPDTLVIDWRRALDRLQRDGDPLRAAVR
jgi:bifunctional non-homologous end joining protein LigD